MKKPLLSFALSILFLAFGATAISQTKPKKITILKVDNTVMTGEMVSLNDQRVVIRGIDGSEKTVPIDEVYELIFDAQPAIHASPQLSSVPPASSAKRVDPEVFARCLAAFRRLLSAVEVGVTYLEYRRELLEAKLELDRAIVDMPESTQRTDVLEAFEDFKIAADSWQVGLQNSGIPTKTDFYRALNTRYELGVDPRIGRKVDHAVLLKLIWAKASERLTHAMTLQR
jgi:hypothetical protein